MKTLISDGHPGSRTAHLTPVIDFLKAQGYTPATKDAFYFNRDGLGTYGFTELLDTALLQAHFTFPPGIHLDNGSLMDKDNFVCITQDWGAHGRPDGAPR